jgi:hypothetical protein
MLSVVLAWLAAVTAVMAGYCLVWLFCPPLRDWMEAPRDRLLEGERRFPRVARTAPVVDPPCEPRQRPARQGEG